MKTINNNVFLSKIYQKIRNGEYDTFLNIPFMTRELLYTSMKAKIQKKIDTNGTPILNDTDIKDSIAETKETALNIIALYMRLGFMERTDEGYIFTKKGDLAIKAAYRS